MLSHQTRLGPLQCCVIPAPIPPASHIVALCHGFGADPQDLLPAAQMLATALGPKAASLCFVLPQAPLPLRWPRHPGRAWWPIDLDGLQAPGAAAQRLRALREGPPDGVGAARQALRACLEAALQQVSVGYDRLVLGGFSQGAMLALDVALRLEEAPAGLMLLSTALMDESGVRARAPARAGLAVLQSHGDADPVLPLTSAQQLHALLRHSGMATQWQGFSGGHTVPPDVIGALGNFVLANMRRSATGDG